MTYSTPIVKGKLLSRPNRFIAIVEVGGEEITVHVKNTGRCKELLPVGATVYLAAAENPARKTPYDLVAVEKVHSFFCKPPLLCRSESMPLRQFPLSCGYICSDQANSIPTVTR